MDSKRGEFMITIRVYEENEYGKVELDASKIDFIGAHMSKDSSEFYKPRRHPIPSHIHFRSNYDTRMDDSGAFIGSRTPKGVKSFRDIKQATAYAKRLRSNLSILIPILKEQGKIELKQG